MEHDPIYFIGYSYMYVCRNCRAIHITKTVSRHVL